MAASASGVLSKGTRRLLVSTDVIDRLASIVKRQAVRPLNHEGYLRARADSNNLAQGGQDGLLIKYVVTSKKPPQPIMSIHLARQLVIRTLSHKRLLPQSTKTQQHHWEDLWSLARLKRPTLPDDWPDDRSPYSAQSILDWFSQKSGEDQPVMSVVRLFLLLMHDRAVFKHRTTDEEGMSVTLRDWNVFECALVYLWALDSDCLLLSEQDPKLVRVLGLFAVLEGNESKMLDQAIAKLNDTSTVDDRNAVIAQAAKMVFEVVGAVLCLPEGLSRSITLYLQVIDSLWSRTKLTRAQLATIMGPIRGVIVAEARERVEETKSIPTKLFDDFSIQVRQRVGQPRQGALLNFLHPTKPIAWPIIGLLKSIDERGELRTTMSEAEAQFIKKMAFSLVYHSLERQLYFDAAFGITFLDKNFRDEFLKVTPVSYAGLIHDESTKQSASVAPTLQENKSDEAASKGSTSEFSRLETSTMKGSNADDLASQRSIEKSASEKSILNALRSQKLTENDSTIDRWKELISNERQNEESLPPAQ